MLTWLSLDQVYLCQPNHWKPDQVNHVLSNQYLIGSNLNPNPSQVTSLWNF